MGLTDAVRPSPLPSPASASRSMSPLPSSVPSSPTRVMRPVISTVPTSMNMTVPSTPTKKENRRRSWFGLVTPTRKEKDRSVSASASLPVPAGRESGADDTNYIEELDVTPQRRSVQDGRARTAWDTQDDAHSDSDIDLSDWEITGTIRRRRPTRDEQQQEDASPIRQKDMATLAILSRNNTAKPRPLTSRIFSRTANDQAAKGPTSPDLSPSDPQTLASLPQRSSSITGQPMTSVLAAPVLAPLPLFIDKSPPTVDKPLPPPPHDADFSLRAASLPLFPAPPTTTPGFRVVSPQVISSPLPPTDIVVTPSSPLDRNPFDMPLYDRPFSAPPASPPSTTSQLLRMQRSESPTPMSAVSGIGLGLPDNHPRRTGPPRRPLPAVQSVSSPLPAARSASPVTKVTFSTQQGSHDHEARESTDKVKAPRPRSFSAMFSRSPLLNLEQTDDDSPGSSSSSTKFNWLGVRKTIKRRRSEAKLAKDKSPPPEQESRPSNSSSFLLIGSDGRPESSFTSPTVRSEAHSREASTPSFVHSFILPPVVQTQEEWWPARQWNNVSPERSPVTALPPGQPPTDDKEEMMFADTDSRESYGSSSRRLANSRTSSLLSNSGHGLGSLPELDIAPALASLPEGGVAPPTAVTPFVEQSEPPAANVPRRDHNRRRSYSDAGRRSFIPMTDEPQSLTNSPRTNFLAALAGDAAPKSPKPPRPTSTTFVKMRNVFTINGRSRSNSALRFGDEREDGRETPFTRPGSAASSFLPSPALPPVRIRPEDVPQVSQLQLQTGADDRQVILMETPERSPRSSYAASLTSTTRTSQSTRRSMTADPYAQGAARTTRARAQTVSSTGPPPWSSSYGLTAPSNMSTGGTFGPMAPPSVHGTFGGVANSVHTFGPIATSPHGQAASIHHSVSAGSASHLPIPTPTFPTSGSPQRRPSSIRRLSTGLFRNGAVSPKPHLVRSGSGPLNIPDDFSPGSQPQSRSPSVMGLAGIMAVEKGLDKKDIDTKVHEEDTPESYLARVQVISRRQLSSIIAEKADKFHMDVLRLYMSRFDFYHTALDVALRRLLMDLSLPKETQQIDRVVETFSQRYDMCEPGIFGTKDNTYVLAFSMMMLHTDAFNRHNKNKMTKADYVRNTRLDGVPETVLEAFYDNITFTPFVFIEDDNEASLAAVGASTVSNGPVRPGKVDVYDMIATGTIMTLRANVESLIPPDSPFSCMGTQPFLDVDKLQACFALAHPLSFVKSRPRRKSSVTMPGMPMGQTPGKSVSKEEIQTLKITKVGLITRKDDTLVNGKRASGRKWKSWSVILTGSQLLFFKDTILALTLVEQIRSSANSAQLPRMTGFQPDDVLSVKDCVAVWDREYTEMPTTFRFIMPEGRQFLMQVLDEGEMNEWLTLINYAATFKSAGIRMRAQQIESGEAVLAGTVAAESHRKDLASGNGTPTESTPPVSRAIIFAEPNTDVESTPAARPKLRRVGSLRAAPTPKVDIAGANDVVVGGGEQIEAVIGSVKAELAAGRGAMRPLSMAPRSHSVSPVYKSLRSDAIQDRVKQLREAAEVIEKRLASNLRLGRNLALLTPFQKVTRDRIEAAVPDLAAAIRTDRIDLAKLHLWITMLLKDQEREEREWARVRHVALQAAAKSLRNGMSVMDRRATLANPIEIPKLSLPDTDNPWTDPSSPTLLSPEPVSPMLRSAPPRVSRGESSGSSELPTTTPPSRMSAMSGVSGVSSVSGISASGISASTSDEPASNSQRNSSASGSSDYELASEYLSASSVLSLQEQLERHLSLSADLSADLTLGAGIASLNSSSANSPSPSPASPTSRTNGSIGTPNGSVPNTPTARSNGSTRPPPPRRQVPPVPDDDEECLSEKFAANGSGNGSGNGNGNGNGTGPGPYGARRASDHGQSLLGGDDDAPGEMAEHWRNTRAATKVSLARLPRGGLGEIQQRKFGQSQSWI